MSLPGIDIYNEDSEDETEEKSESESELEATQEDGDFLDVFNKLSIGTCETPSKGEITSKPDEHNTSQIPVNQISSSSIVQLEDCKISSVTSAFIEMTPASSFTTTSKLINPTTNLTPSKIHPLLRTSELPNISVDPDSMRQTDTTSVLNADSNEVPSVTVSPNKSETSELKGKTTGGSLSQIGKHEKSTSEERGVLLEKLLIQHLTEKLKTTSITKYMGSAAAPTKQRVGQCVAVMDTNILMNDLSLLESLKHYPHVRLCIPFAVMSELDGLKKSKDKGRQARSGVRFINRQLEDRPDAIWIQRRDECVTKKRGRRDRYRNNDDDILDCCLYLQSQYGKPPRKARGEGKENVDHDQVAVVLLTLDDVLKAKSRSAGVPPLTIKELFESHVWGTSVL